MGAPSPEADSGNILFVQRSSPHRLPTPAAGAPRQLSTLRHLQAAEPTFARCPRRQQPDNLHEKHQFAGQGEARYCGSGHLARRPLQPYRPGAGQA